MIIAHSLAAQENICNSDTSLCYGVKKFNTDFEIQMEKKWESQQYVAQYQTPISFDIDNDCVPEIITADFLNYDNNWLASNQLLFLNSKTLNSLQTLKTNYFLTKTNSFIVVDIDNDKSFETIVALADLNINPNNLRGKLICYNFDNSIRWISDNKYTINTLQAGSLSLADFNKDGTPEVFINNNIFNAITGVQLLKGGNFGLGGAGFSTISIAADLDDNPNDLELAAGYTVYEIEITNPNGTLGNNMIPNNILINGIGRDGQTAVADINNDQKLDVIVITAQSFYSAIYVYTFQNNSYQIISKIEWPKYVPLGTLSIGRLNNNNENSILISASKNLIKFSYNTNLLNEGGIYQLKMTQDL
ncbi:MAG: hypothetical protein R2774_12775 [Saprospiraceae bacterium]